MKKRILSFILCVATLASVLTVLHGCVDADSNSVVTTITTTTTTTTKATVTTTEAVSTTDLTTREVTTQPTTQLTTTTMTTTTHRPTTQSIPTTAVTTWYRAPSVLISAATTTTKPTTTTVQTEAPTPIVSNMYFYKVERLADYFVDGDILHVVTKLPNMYMEIDTNTGAVLRAEYLPAQPTYMKRIDDKLWITYGALRCINVYDEETFELENQFSFDFELFDMFPPLAFDVYGDYIFVAEESSGVWRYNMKTQEITLISYVYVEADIAIDQNTGLVYIGESGCTGSKLYCFDAETLELKSQYVAQKYGIDNYTRKVFLREDGVYWGNYRFALDDVSQVLQTYRSPEYHGIGMYYVTDKYVVTTSGYFDRVTGELLWEKGMHSYYSCAAVTDSGNVIWTESDRFIIMTNRLP